MSWITLQQAQLAYGHWPLLDKVDFSLNEQERVGLIGRNGAGKSSLLRILAGLEQPDDGQVQATQGLQRAYVEQEARFAPDMSVFDAVAGGLAQVREWMRQYESGEGDLDRPAPGRGAACGARGKPAHARVPTHRRVPPREARGTAQP